MSDTDASEWRYCTIKTYADPHCIHCGTNIFWPPPPENKIRKYNLEQSVLTPPPGSDASGHKASQSAAATPPGDKLSKDTAETMTPTRTTPPLTPHSGAQVSAPRIVVPWDEGSPEAKAARKVELEAKPGSPEKKQAKSRCMP